MGDGRREMGDGNHQIPIVKILGYLKGKIMALIQAFAPRIGSIGEIPEYVVNIRVVNGFSG